MDWWDTGILDHGYRSPILLIHVYLVAATTPALPSCLEERVKQIALVLLFEGDQIPIDGREAPDGSVSSHTLSKSGRGSSRVFLFFRIKDLPIKDGQWRRGALGSDGFGRSGERSQEACSYQISQPSSNG